MSALFFFKQKTAYEMIGRMSADSVLVQHGISWSDYEELLDAIGEASSLRICYDEGTLQVMTLSQRHEKYSTLIERMVDRLSSFLRVKVLFYGSATMRKKQKQKGVEPDACFYIQNASLVGTKDEIDFNTDPPPDVVVEIDLHHDSISKFPIYAAFGVPEFWRYDRETLTIFHLREGQYEPSPASLSLPFLTSHVLIEFLGRIAREDQYDIL